MLPERAFEHPLFFVPRDELQLAGGVDAASAPRLLVPEQKVLARLTPGLLQTRLLTRRGGHDSGQKGQVPSDSITGENNTFFLCVGSYSITMDEHDSRRESHAALSQPRHFTLDFSVLQQKHNLATLSDTLVITKTRGSTAH